MINGQKRKEGTFCTAGPVKESYGDERKGRKESSQDLEPFLHHLP